MSRQASGLRAWAMQRITAAYIGIYMLYMLVHFITDAPASHEAWRAWISGPVASLGAMIFFLSVFLISFS